MQFITTISLVTLLVVSSSTALPDQYGAPPIQTGGGVGGGYGGSGGFGGGDQGPTSPAQYSYAYENVDGASGNNFGHGEERDGDTTQGEYRVLLPDGRTQIVKYFVTAEGGYVADVTYEGTANVGGGKRPAGGDSYAAPPTGGSGGSGGKPSTGYGAPY